LLNGTLSSWTELEVIEEKDLIPDESNESDIDVMQTEQHPGVCTGALKMLKAHVL